jgi:hypothetical protein
VTISNSGLVAVTVFTRLLAGAYDISNLSPNQRVVWGTTLVSFSITAMLYGVDVTGMAGPAIWMTALVLLFTSAFCSLNSELALADIKKNDRASG